MKHPPSFCEHVLTDSKGTQWVEVVICAFICKATDCPCYLELMKNSQTRIKLLNTEPLTKTCPFCSSNILTKTDVETTYVCNTTGDRLKKEYNKLCGKKSNRTSRRR